MSESNPYQQPAPYYQPPVTTPVSGLAIASMVSGIIADLMVIATCCFGPTIVLAGPIGIAAAAMGYFALKECNEQGKEGRGMAIAGMACGGTALVLFLLALLVGVAYFGFFIFMATQAKNR